MEKCKMKCIDSTFVSSVGKFVDAFEKKIVEYTRATCAVVCVNGTNALYGTLMFQNCEYVENIPCGYKRLYGGEYSKIFSSTYSLPLSA